MELRALRYFVAVATDGTVRGAAERLHVSQPPLSRAIQQLEVELGADLFTRSARGMVLTEAGAALLPGAREVLERADALPVAVAGASGTRTITIGTLADSIDHAGLDLIDRFRERHPGVEIRVVEGDLTDPTIGVGRGVADVALTRGPFTAPDLAVAAVRLDPVGVMVREGDPVLGRAAVRLADLEDRSWFVLPEGTDPRWRAFWSASTGDAPRAGTVVRTVREAVQSVRWSGAVGLVPRTETRHPGLVVVPVEDAPLSPLVVAWRRRDRRSLVHGFVELASARRREDPRRNRGPSSRDPSGI